LSRAESPLSSFRSATPPRREGLAGEVPRAGGCRPQTPAQTALGASRHPGAGQEQVRTRTESSGLGVTSAIGRGLAAPAPPRSGEWVGRVQRTGGSVAVPSVRRQCIGAPVGRT
jgi:hypothetical protein